MNKEFKKGYLQALQDLDKFMCDNEVKNVGEIMLWRAKKIDELEEIISSFKFKSKYQFEFRNKNGEIVTMIVEAGNILVAEILAKADRIKEGQPYEIVSEKLLEEDN